jgi:hypothetical protein
MEEQRWFRTVDAAWYIGVSPSTLEKLRGIGGGPIYSRPPGLQVVIYAREDLDEWVRSGCRRRTSEGGAD